MKKNICFIIDFRIERTEGRERTLTAVEGKGALCIHTLSLHIALITRCIILKEIGFRKVCPKKEIITFYNL